MGFQASGGVGVRSTDAQAMADAAQAASLQKLENLSDLADVADALANLGIDDEIAAVTNAVLKTIVNAAGDLLVGTGDDAVGRLAKGTKGLALIAGASTLAWGVATHFLRNYWKVGEYLMAPATGTTTTALATGTMNLCQLDVPVDVTIDAIIFEVTANGTGSPVARPVIYTDADGDGVPDTLFHDFLAATAASLGIKTVAPQAGTLVVPAGSYWGGVVPQGGLTDPTYRCVAASPYAQRLANASTALSNVQHSFQVTGVTGAPAGSITPNLLGVGANPVRWGLRRSA